MDEILTDEQQMLADTCKAIIDAIQKLIENIVEALIPVFQSVADYISNAWDNFLYYYCSGRVRHLALYAKKARVRKKNLLGCKNNFGR